MNFLVVTAASIGVLVVMHGLTFAIGRRIGRYNVVDVTWGLGFVGVAVVGLALGSGDLFRRILLSALVAVWGLRLAWHMVGKSAGKGEDPRYEKLLGGDFSAGHVLRKIFLIQAAATWFVSLPLQVSAVLGPTPTRCSADLDCGRCDLVCRPALRSGRRPPAAPVQGRSGQQGRGDGPRSVGVDAPSQLLWRRLRVVGAVAGLHRWVDFAGYGAFAGVDDVLPGLRDWCAADRGVHEGPSGIPRIPFSYILFRSTTAQIAIIMTILACVDRLPLVTTDLDALLRQVAQRDVDAFAAFYDLTRARVFGLVTRVLRDPGYSEETTQDIYLQVWRSRGQLRPEGGLAAGVAADGGTPARGGPRSRRAGGQPARVPLRGGQRRATGRSRRRLGHPA